MQLVLEPYLIAAAILLLLSVLASRLSDRLGIPILLIFIAVGMLAGSDGIGGYYFDNAALSQYIGTAALVIILFSGGLDTQWKNVKPVVGESLTLATLGVFLTAIITALAAYYILKLGVLTSALIGVTVSSTDAAAVFGILRSKGVRLQPKLKSLLEFESGSNDPMAIFLTITVLSWVNPPGLGVGDAILKLVQQMTMGAVFGLAAGRVTLWMINRLRLGYDGLYPVLVFAMVFLTFSGANLLGGSGFLAIYVMGIVLGSSEFLHKHSLLSFYDGFAWLSQAILFLVLGLLVFPSRMVQFALPSLAIALVLMFIARPLSVFLCLIPFKTNLREKLLISWTGLRGAVPVVLATYPFQAGVSDAPAIFNVVFFVVLSSVLLQGSLLAWVARRLGLDIASKPAPLPEALPLTPSVSEIQIPPNANAVGKSVFELGLPEGYKIVLVRRGEDYILPDGATVFAAGDVVQGLASGEDQQEAHRVFTAPPSKKTAES